MKSTITMFLLTLTFTTFANEQPTSTNEQSENTVEKAKRCYITYEGEDRIRTQECHRYLYEHDDEFRVNVVNIGPGYIPRGGIERYTISVANRENPERIIVHREPTFDAQGRDRNIGKLTEDNRNDINQYFYQIAAASSENTVANEKECYITYEGEDRIRTQTCHHYLKDHDQDYFRNVVNIGPGYIPRGGIERYTISVANRENPERIIVHREPTFDAQGRDRNIGKLTEENRNDINQYFYQIAADSEVPPAFSWGSIEESCRCEGDMTNNDNLYACFVKNKDETCARDIWVKIDLEYRVAKEKQFLGNDFDEWLTFANRFCEEEDSFDDNNQCVKQFINQYNINDERLLNSLSDLAEGECRGNSNTNQNVESLASQSQLVIQRMF